MLLHILLRDEEEFEGGGDVGGADIMPLVIINCISYELNKWIVGGGLTAPTSFLFVEINHQ
jgi:hypothetical protein